MKTRFLNKMNRKKFTFFLIIFSFVLFLLSKNCYAVSITKDFSGPMYVSFSLTIEIDSATPSQGGHLMDISLTVVDFADATSLNNTEIIMSIYGTSGILFTNRALLGNLSQYYNSVEAQSAYNYFNSWGRVNMDLRVVYIYCNSTYTSEQLSTDWITFTSLTSSSYSLPPNTNPDSSTPWGRIIGYIIVCVISLAGSVGYYFQRSSKKSSLGIEEKIESQNSQIPLTYCSYCGNQTEADEKFCFSCGRSLKGE